MCFYNSTILGVRELIWVSTMPQGGTGKYLIHLLYVTIDHYGVNGRGKPLFFFFSFFFLSLSFFLFLFSLSLIHQCNKIHLYHLAFQVVQTSLLFVVWFSC